MTYPMSLKATTRARVRIAVPSFGLRMPGAQAVPRLREKPKVEDFKRLLDAALHPGDVDQLRLSKFERRQLAVSKRVRRALYDPA